ncbi:MAG: hypothetical protein ACEQSK_20895, partial [Sphingomonadaceae bacterium]
THPAVVNEEIDMRAPATFRLAAGLALGTVLATGTVGAWAQSHVGAKRRQYLLGYRGLATAATASDPNDKRLEGNRIHTA